MYLSARAEKTKDVGVMMKKFVQLYEDQYHEETRPEGVISLGVAENHLMDKEILEITRKAITETLDVGDTGYGDGLTASARLHLAMSNYMNDYFHPLEPVKPQHVMFSNGCTALFDQVANVMCDEGDGVLIPVPYYNAYNHDFSLRTGAVLVPVPVAPMDEGLQPGSIDAWEETVQRCKEQGVKPRMMIVTNPHNPLARTFPAETILALAKFAEKEDLQLIMNEIYAKSIYDNEDWPEAPVFKSALSIDFEKELGSKFDRSRLHLVYGMSKDFCANGYRIGVLVSQHNPALTTALSSTGFYMKISSLSDAVWSHMLNDREWLDWFLAENKKRLGEAAKFTRDWFTVRGVPVARTNAANFMMVDLGHKLETQNEAGEKALGEKLLNAGVFIARGMNYANPVPGWFRVTFCAEPKKLRIGLQRIEDALGLRPSTLS